MNPPEFPRPSRGEIWEGDWSPGRGSEQTGKRPALVIQNDHGNHSSLYPNTMVAAITSHGREIPFHVFVRKARLNGLMSDSYVKCEQLITISKERLIGKAWGKLTEDEMGQVAEALRRSLALT